MLSRPASPTDTFEVVARAHAMKRCLAAWSPTYFRPRDGAEERHAAFLGYLIGSPDHATIVLEDDGRLVGFFAVVVQSSHRWVDDLYLADPDLWPAAIDVVDQHVAAPWVSCVSRFDERRAAAMSAAGLEIRSTYWARTITSWKHETSIDEGPLTVSPDGGPAHTFGGAPFDPTAPGALTVTAPDGGYVIGSPSVEPPLYDPGGPSCVIDRIVGLNRASLLDAAMTVAANRGDAAMVVVSDASDEPLETLLAQAGFRAEVDLFVRSGRLDPSRIAQRLEEARQGLDRVAPSELDRAIAQGALVVDTRPESNRHAEGELSGAVLVERIHLEWRLDPTSPDRIPEATAGRRVIIVCNEGYSSSLAAESLRALGVDATDLIGGFRALRSE